MPLVDSFLYSQMYSSLISTPIRCGKDRQITIRIAKAMLVEGEREGGREKKRKRKRGRTSAYLGYENWDTYYISLGLRSSLYP